MSHIAKKTFILAAFHVRLVKLTLLNFRKNNFFFLLMLCGKIAVHRISISGHSVAILLLRFTHTSPFYSFIITPASTARSSPFPKRRKKIHGIKRIGEEEEEEFCVTSASTHKHFKFVCDFERAISFPLKFY